MYYTRIRDKIESLVYDIAYINHEDRGAFHSPHEGWAVIKEEVEEVADEVVDLHSNCHRLFEHVRLEHSKEDHVKHAQEIYERSIRVALEAIDTAVAAKEYLEDCELGVNHFSHLVSEKPS